MPDVDPTFFGTHHQRRQHHALNHQPWRAAEQFPVFERARLAFVGIADHIFGLPGRATHSHPFAECGEACAAHAPQARNLEFFQKRIRFHAFKPTLHSQVFTPAVVNINGQSQR